MVAAVAVLFAASLYAMGSMPQNFFPSLDKPYFRADVLLPEGFGIRDTERSLQRMEAWLREQPEVKTVSTTAGATPPRYYLASSSVSLRPNFGNLLVELHDKRQTGRRCSSCRPCRMRPSSSVSSALTPIRCACSHTGPRR